MQALLNAIAVMEKPEDVQRIFHGRGGLFPGCEHLVLDAYPPVWVLTSFQPLPDDDLRVIGAALQHRLQQIAPEDALNWVYQCRHGGQSQTQLMGGAVPEQHVVTERGARYRVHVLKGQNHGLFLDMAEGRRWVREQMQACPKLKVLNLFAYTCAFSVAALQGGAKQVINLDMSQGALTIGQQNHQLNGYTSGASFLAHDLFKSWGKVSRGGPYDLIIVDPPSFQKGSFVATKDYARLMRRLPELLEFQGQVLLCLNAPELGVEFLRALMAEQAPELQFVERLANPISFADVSEDRSLKVLVYAARD
jgi:23S rRNA (cytosine1962-C5)-methyltransferase